MKFVLAPDSFKENMTALEAAEAMRRGVTDVFPDAQCLLVPMSDGGEGFIDAIATAWNAQRVEADSVDALGRPIRSTYALAEGRAVLDVASCAGIELVAPEDRCVEASTTRGLGMLIRDALARGAHSLLVGIGGSATNDCGAGMLVELGVHLFDEVGARVDPLPGELARVARIDTSELDALLSGVDIRVACDVTNPLTGAEGATAVFGPQKGVTPQMQPGFDAALGHFAAVCGREGEADMPGSGAAGGLGFALRALCGARLVPGVELVAEAVGLAGAMEGADWAFTGEGSVDSQTIKGKTPAGVFEVARLAGVPTMIFAGRIKDGAEVLLEHGVVRIVKVGDPAEPLARALRNGQKNLRAAVAGALREL
ncbi:glycerate kinase [Schaalia sp. 19OD2882]|uniref:glycerate kinase n=1 Tax=Schaalia sp. 19OD2882 TaxID=2794089 RepID=UPI001C1EDDEB|nr:glycerate kinase [Schaalia sp. 19OD2882]QWW19661.1 glycerate kinase [Schaalia sp. 19OD2882]